MPVANDWYMYVFPGARRGSMIADSVDRIGGGVKDLGHAVVRALKSLEACRKAVRE